MTKLNIKFRQTTRAKFLTKFALATAVFSLIGCIVFFSFFSLQTGHPKLAEAAPVTYTTLATGNWTNALTVWSTNGSTPCLCTPGAAPNSKNVVINHTITMNTNVSVSGTSNVTVSSTGKLNSVNYKLDVLGGLLTSSGTINIAELYIASGASGSFSGPLTATSRIRVDGAALFNSSTTVTSGDLELRAGSVITPGDGWQASLPAGNIINEGTITFDGHRLIILNGGFINKSTGNVAGFGYIETRNGTQSNNGTWNTYVDWCTYIGQGLNGLPEPRNCFAPTGTPISCENSYILDWKNPATYTVDCGDVNASNWNVKGMTCWFTSPLFNVPGIAGGPNRLADLSVRINQSGNVGSNDSATVYYYVNGVVSRYDMYQGAGSPAVFTSARKILVKAGGTYQIKIRLKNDQSNELWQIKSNDITACLISFFPPPSPLPVSLTSFKAETQNNNSVLLNWETAAEVNNNYFTLERSKDGNQFSILTKVKGSGSTSNIHQYSYYDNNPFEGTSYYRLKQTDFNGLSTIYKPVTVSLNTQQNSARDLQVWPNPFNDSFTARFETESDEEVQLRIVSSSGKVVHNEKIVVHPGSNQFRFTAPSGFSEGNYILSISNSKMLNTSKKLVCQKK